MHKETPMKEIDVVRAIQLSSELNALTMLCKDFFRCPCGMLATRTMSFIPVRVKVAAGPYSKVGEEFDWPTNYYGSYCDLRGCEVDPKTKIDIEKLEIIGPTMWVELPHVKIARRFNALLLRESP